MNKDLVFIASGGRTGTQFLGDKLSSVVADCFSEHEPDVLYGFKWRTFEQIRNFGIWHMTVGRLLGMTGVRVLGQRLLAGDVSTEVAHRRILQSRRRYHLRIPQHLIVESNGQWWYLTGDLLKLWPNAKLIGVIRDPRSWVRSWLNYHSRYDDLDRADYFPPGRLTPAKLKETEWEKRWDEIGVFGQLLWEWRTTYQHMSDHMDQISNAKMFQFEDLFHGDGSAMTELVNFAAQHGDHCYDVKDLTGFVDQVRNASNGGIQDWPSWSGKDARLLDELCGSLMKRYGYGNEPDWQKKLEES